MTESVHTTLISSWEELERNWSRFPFQRKAETFFQELPILKVWWESIGRPELHSIMVEEASEFIAFFPLCMFEGKLQLLGDKDVTDYNDVLIISGKEHLAWQAFADHFAHLPTVQQLTLVSIPETSSSPQNLTHIAEARGWQLTQTEQDVCPIIELPATWEEYLSQIGKKQRHEVTRKWKRLGEQLKIEFRVITDTRQDPKALTEFFQLHRQSSPDKTAFWTPNHQSYFEKLSSAASEHGWLRLYFIDLNGESAAAMYCFDYQDSLLIYNSGFNAEKYLGLSVGNVLTSYTIQDAINLKKKTYDFLRGSEEYKFRYRAIPHPVFDLLVQKAAAE